MEIAVAIPSETDCARFQGRQIQLTGVAPGEASDQNVSALPGGWILVAGGLDSMYAQRVTPLRSGGIAKLRIPN